MRGYLGLGDRGRHRPGRVQDDAGDLRRQRRRGLFGLADDDAIAPHDDIVLDGLGKGGGDVDHDIALAEAEIHVLEPLQRGLELADALLHGDVHRRERARRHRAGRRQPMTGLEAFHGISRILVEGAARLVGGEIPGEDQPLAQQIVIGALDAEGELGVRGNARPAATHGKIGIAQGSVLDPLRAALVIGRLVRHRECRGRTALRRRCGRRGSLRRSRVSRIGGGRHRARGGRRLRAGLAGGLGLSKRGSAGEQAHGNDHGMAIRHLCCLPHEDETRTGRA